MAGFGKKLGCVVPKTGFVKGIMKNGVVQSAEDSYASITDYVASVRCIEDSAE